MAADAPSGGGGSGHGTPRTPSSPASFRENTPVASRSSSPVPVAGAFPETVDNDILFLMCNKYGYDANRVRTSVNENLFDSTMATYLILLDRKAMYPKLHTADMRAANNLAEVRPNLCISQIAAPSHLDPPLLYACSLAG